MRGVRFILFFLHFGAFAQSKKLDSLYRELFHTKHDSMRAKIEYRIAYHHYRANNDDSSYIHFLSAHQAGYRGNSKQWIKESGKELGFYFTDMGELDSAIKYFNNATSVIEKDDPDDFELFSGLGNIYFFKGDYIKSYEAYLHFLKLAELGKNPTFISRAYSSVGVALKEQKKLNESLVFLKKSQEIAEQHHLIYNNYVALINIGNFYSEKYKKEKSRYNYEMTLLNYSKAVALIDSMPKDKFDFSSIILLYGNIGNTYADTKEFDKALNEYSKALKILEEFGSFEAISLFYNNLASIYIDLKNVAMAETYLKKAYKAALGVSGSASELMENYGTTSRFYELKNDFRQAYYYQLRYKTLSDSLYSTENAEKRKEIELNAEYEKKETEAKAALEKKELIEEEEKKKQKIIRNAFVGGFLLMLFVAFLIFRGYKQKQKSNEIITLQKMEVEKQKELVEEKQKEIIDSIRYAKRIQQSLFPTEKYIERIFKK